MGWMATVARSSPSSAAACAGAYPSSSSIRISRRGGTAASFIATTARRRLPGRFSPASSSRRTVRRACSVVFETGIT